MSKRKINLYVKRIRRGKLSREKNPIMKLSQRHIFNRMIHNRNNKNNQ